MNNSLISVIALLVLLLNACEGNEAVLPDRNGPVIESFDPKSGTEGTSVTITGANFSNNTKQCRVILGGKSIEPDNAAFSMLTFTVPAGIEPGSYTLGVKMGNTTSGSKEKFTVYSGANPGNFTCTDVVPVTSAIISKCFYGFGKNGIHPRLIFTENDIIRLKQVVSSDAIAKASYDEVISQANAIMGTPLLAYGLDGANLRITNIHTFSNDQAPYLVLAWQLTKDTRYAQRCWQQVEAMTRWPDWGAARHFLDTGIGAKGVALVYDGCYDFLTSDQRTTIATALRKFALDPGKTQIETGTGAWKWYLSDNNWNGICHGGLIMAALAVFETDPAFMGRVIELAVNGIVPYMKSLEPDGASPEGMMYWSYGLSNTFLAFESMKNVLSTTYGLSEFPGFKKTPAFPYKVSGPAGTATMGDDYLYYGVSNRFLSFFWYGYHFNDADFSKMHYDACLARNGSKTVKFNGWMDLLFYRPALVAAGGSVSPEINGYVKGAEYLYLLEKNGDPGALYAGMHGGDNNASHGHLDAGTFFIQASGENFAVGNLGREDPYPADYFTVTSPSYQQEPVSTASTPGRFYYYRVRTEAKNCLVFNPDARPEQNPEGVAKLIREGNGTTGGFYILDLTGCYNRDVTGYSRGIQMDRNRKFITVQDEFNPTRISTVYWLMHSPATDGAMISPDGKTATMTKNGKTFYAVIRSPAEARFEKTDRSETSVGYLPETLPVFSKTMAGKNSINKWYGKLLIRLNGVKAGEMTTIRVDFAKDPVTPSAVTGLSDWNTVN